MCQQPVQNTKDIQQQTVILLKDPDCESICWVGLYGSFARSTQTAESDVDLVIGYKPDIPTRKIYLTAGTLSMNGEKAFGRESYVMLEALLTCVTVYGSEEWPRRLQEEARELLDDGYRRFKESHSLLHKMQDLLFKTNKEVTFVSHPDLNIICLAKQIASNLDFPETHPFHNGLFTPVLRWVETEKDLLQRAGTVDSSEEDSARIWELMTRDFEDYRKSLESAYITMVEQTYHYAEISLPS